MILKLLVWFEYFLGKVLGTFSSSRVAFEKRNEWEPGAISFKDDDTCADLCVEFSSEGEFEQIRYLLEQILKDPKRKIEIIFCSESVEKAVLSFQAKYRSQVRYQRLCLYYRTKIDQLEQWVSADRLILVRYDFFPQLLQLGSEMEMFGLFSASVKSLKNKNIVIKSIYKKVFSLFDLIVPVNQRELEWFNSEFVNESQDLIQADLRVDQIKERSKDAGKTLEAKFSAWNVLDKFLGQTNRTKVIIGNFWVDEINYYALDELVDLLKKGEISLSIAPHNLGEDTNKAILEYFKENGIKVIHITEASSFEDLNEDSVLLFDIKGVLCELYNYFDIAMVGGGFLRSSHSLLEPYVAGAKVITGPGINKSSEFDYIMAQNDTAIRVHSGKSALNSSSWTEWTREKNFRDLKNDDKLSSLMEKVLSDQRL